MMKLKPTIRLAAALLLASIALLPAQSTAFTYQGRLQDGGTAPTGLYDFEFRLFNAASGGTQQGPTVTLNDLGVTNGLFNTALDFGANFPGADRFLQLSVRPGASVGTYTNLNPRQPITATPYAIRSLEAAGLPAGAVSGAMLADGAVTAAKIAPGAVSQLGASDGSPVNALQVNTNGMVGVGTNAPQAGLHIASSQSFTNLELVARLQDESDGYTNLFAPAGLAGWGSYLAVAAQGDSGITLIDLSNPTSPQRRFQIRENDGPYTNLLAASAVAMSSNVIAVAAFGESAVTLINWTNPVQPVKLSELRDGVGGWNELFSVSALALSGNLLAMAAPSDAAVTLADISNPAAPIKRAEFKDGFFGYTNLLGVRLVALSGSLLAMGAFNDSTVTLVDVANPGSPVKRAELTFTNGGPVNLFQPTSVALSGNLLAVGAQGGLGLFDVSVPATPVLRAFWNRTPGGDNLGWVSSLQFFDGYLAAASDPLGRAWLFDVRNPLTPVFLTQIRPNVGGVTDMMRPSTLAPVGGNLAVAFFGNGFSNPGEVNVFSIRARSAGLSSDAWVGIGTTQPAAPLHVVGNVAVQQATRVELETVAFEAGTGTIANGQYATAMGYGSRALGYSSTALGFRSLASGDYATALGADSVASGVRALASGHATTASGQNSFACGQASQATGFNSFASGENTLASELATTAIGYHTSATAPGAMAAGIFSKARHNNAYVWSDGSNPDFGSSGPNQFLINATGGVGIGTTNITGDALTVQGTTRLNGPLVAVNGLSVTGSVSFSANLAVAGTVTGNGSGLTSLNAANLTGSVADARLSANVALRGGGNAFTGNQSIAGNLGIGTIAPAFPLQIGDASIPNSQGMMRFASRSGTGPSSRLWDIGVPEGDQDTSGKFYSFVIDDPGLGSQPEMTIRWDSGNVGFGTANPETKFHLYSADNPTTMRIHSSGAPGYGRLEFVSNPQGDINEWRPAFIQSTDAGGFTGGLAFFVNGAGAANKFGVTEVMRLQDGRVGIGTDNPLWRLQVGSAYCTGTTWNNSSDRNVKTNFARADGREVLEKLVALPIQTWNYTNDLGARHLGPMAQDFQAAFGLGNDDKSIATIDADGVALAAIQGLNQKLEETRAENAELKARLEKLEQLLNARNGGAQ